MWKAQGTGRPSYRVDAEQSAWSPSNWGARVSVCRKPSGGEADVGD